MVIVIVFIFSQFHAFYNVANLPFKLEIHVHIQKIIKLYTEHFAFYHM